MPEQREQAIRERAYSIWEQEGRPDGKDLEHWFRAESEHISAGNSNDKTPEVLEMSQSNVIQFPAANERTWIAISRAVREALSPHMDSQVFDWILADLKPRFLKLTLSFNYSVQCPPGCEAVLQETGKAFENFLHEYSNQWLLQMAQLEAELYVAKLG